jgi:putative ABC transport system permease protein
MHPDTRFVIPLTRTINATIDLVNDGQRVLHSVEIVPTAYGDPLLPPNIEIPSDVDTVLISASVAQRLGLSSGDKIFGVLNRRINGVNQHVKLNLHVAAVLPEHSFVREAIFTSLSFLIAAEDYRDGYQVPLLNIDQGKTRAGPRQEFASARIYASGLDEVLSLGERLRAQGLDIRTRAADIETVKRIDQLLTFVFLVIATIAGVGAAVAMGSSVWLNVDRKTESLALLRMMGLFNTGVLLVPLVEALIVAFLGYMLAYVFYLIGAQIFNEQLGASLPEYGYACRLYYEHIAIMLGLVLLFALVVSSLAGIRASRLDPAVCLRESV